MTFWKVGIWVRANGIVVSWLRLQTASDGIPHPYHIYTKCFSTLIFCGWTFGCTLILLYRCKWGWFFWKLVCGWDWMLLWFYGWGYKQLQKASHIHIICIQSVLAPWFAVDWNMVIPLHCYTGAGGGDFFGKLACGWEQMVLWCHGWVYKQLQTASHIHIICIKSVLAPGYAVDRHMGALLHCYTSAGRVEFWKVAVWVSANGVVVSWLRLQTASKGIPHPYHMYTKCFSTLICCGWLHGCTLLLLYLCKWGWILG